LNVRKNSHLQWLAHSARQWDIAGRDNKF